MSKLGLYIHIPFCLQKCPYCDFYSIRYDEELKTEYIAAVISCLEFYSDRSLRVDSIYFGGGTPSLLTARDLNDILEAADKFFSVSQAEITIEANPSSASRDKLAEYLKSGVNRISFGVQSLNDVELSDLGRLHNSSAAIDAINDAKSVGFKNISADLMLGISRQTTDSLFKTIAEFAKLDINHVSAYILSIEENTPYADMSNRLILPNEEETTDLYLAACDELEKNGFLQYEVSNFAKPGFECRHNLKYWQLEEYLGIGPAAHSFFKGRRCYFPRDIKSFIAMNEKRDFTMLNEGDFDPAEEYIMLSLRLKKGLDISKAQNTYGIDIEKIICKAKKFTDHGLAVLENNRMYLTKKGFLVSNYIISELI